MVEQGVQGRWEGEWAGWKKDEEKKEVALFWGVAGFQSWPKHTKKRQKNNILKFPLLDWISGRQKRKKERAKGRERGREMRFFFVVVRTYKQHKKYTLLAGQERRRGTGKDMTTTEHKQHQS